MESPTRPRGPGGRPRRPGVTEAILGATISLLAEAGFENLTLEDIASRAGVSRPTIYRRWSTKEDLLEDAVNIIVDEYLYPQDTGNIRDDLTFMATRLVDQFQTRLPSMWTVYFNLEQAQIAPEAFKRARARTMGMVERAVARGELRPDTDVKLLLQLITGIIWYRAKVVHEDMDSEFAKVIVGMILDSIMGGREPE